jgi:DNA-binding NarL/FixJ family response regulator
LEPPGDGVGKVRETLAMADRVAAGRRAFARRAWREAARALSEAAADLGPADLERLAIAAELSGDDAASAAAWEAAHRGHIEAGDRAEAARCGFWLALGLLLRGEEARGGGWLARTERLLEAAPDCAARGYLLITAFLAALDDGDHETAEQLAEQAIEIGERCGEPDLVALGLLSHGEVLIARGEHGRGLTRLDEVMVAVTADEVGPVTTGIVYCAVVLECMKLLDLSRATEWTRSLARWCDSQPDLVPYRGQCLVHQSQLEQAAGDWRQAAATARRARERLADPPHPAIGLAHYQAGELHRLVGAFDDAVQAYAEGHRHGRQPLPGLALVEAARGDANAAAATIRRGLLETIDALERVPLLAAAVEILSTAGDRAGAHAAADELGALATRATSPVLAAMADRAAGVVALSDDDPENALAHLRRSAAVWQRLRMPYESARNALALAEACDALGDRSAALLEVGHAEAVFTELGAGPDLAAARALAQRLAAPEPSPDASSTTLSARELEVLGHVARGETNREIAGALVISEHTVGRHVEHIFAKLGVTSRSAATAYAYEHGLVTSG